MSPSRTTKWSVLLVFALSLLVAVAASAGGAAASGSGHWTCGPRSSVQIPGGLIDRVPILYSRGLRAAPPPPPQPFYRIGVTSNSSCAVVPDVPMAFFIPAAGEARIYGPNGNALWTKLPRDVTASLRKLVEKVKPYRAPKKLSQVTINDTSADRPSSYLRLYTVGIPTRAARGAGGWISILFFGPTSPWTDGRNSLWISRHGDYLRRDGQLVSISSSLAARIRRAAPIP